MKIVIGAAIGGVIGFGLGYLGKCTSGACPLMSNPAVSTVLGALIGALLAATK